MNLTLDPLLAFLNAEFNNAGIQRNSELFFYTSYLAYRVRLHESSFFVTRLTKTTQPCQYPEWIPQLESGSIAEVHAILDQEPFFLSATDAATQWAGQNYTELHNVR